MKILHTSDWHLGHTLRERTRSFEHDKFLTWLRDVLEREEIDALLVSGDIFETANPSAGAQQMWFEFLATTRRRFPTLDMVIIGGNHDSPMRLDAPNPVLAALNIHVFGGLSRIEASGAIDVDRMVVPVHDRAGGRAWIAAVPFLRASDLPSEVPIDALADGVSTIYREIFEHARGVRSHGEPIVAMGHLYMIDGQISGDSERKILGGNQHPLPVDIFPSDVAYVALGHLHKAQSVGNADHIRYSGSPIPLSMAEVTYSHQVCVVDLDASGVRNWRALPIPRTVELVRFPAEGAAPLAEVLRLLATLPQKQSMPEECHPFLEIVVATDGPTPGLMERIQDALVDKAAYIVKVTRDRSAEQPSADSVIHRQYSQEEVFVERYIREHQKSPPPEYLRAFHELVEKANQETP